MTTNKNLMIGLISFTGLVHLAIGIITTLGEFSFINLSVLFNGLGYFVLIYVIYFSTGMGFEDKQLKQGLAGYTLITIIAYFVIFGLGGLENIIGIITKLVEVVIIVLLIRDM